MCLCNCVRMCLFLGPGLLFVCFVLFMNISCVIEFWSACESTICSCTFLLFVWFYICVWPGTMLSSCMILTFFSLSQTLLHRICLALSKRNREMRGLFPPFLLFSLQLNYIPLLFRLPFPFLLCLFLGGVTGENSLAYFLSLLPRTLQMFYAVSHFLSAFISILDLSLVFDLRCMMYWPVLVFFTLFYPNKLKCISRVGLLWNLDLEFIKKKNATFVRTWKWDEQNVPKAWNEAMFSSLKLRLLRWINTKCCKIEVHAAIWRKLNKTKK